MGRNATGANTRPPPPAYIDLAETGRRLGISRSYARRLAMRGAFGPLLDVSTGTARGAFRVRADAVESFIESRAFDPKAV